MRQAMETGDPRYALIAELGDWLADKVVRISVRRFQRMPPQMTDVLKHFWDEICAQVQGEESVVGNLYQEVVADTIRSVIKDWPQLHLQTLWLRTDEGTDWLCEEDVSVVPVNTNDIVNMLEQRVYDLASNVSNSRIELFNAREHD